MRGSPFVRSIILSLALVATALGLLRVTSTRSTNSTTRPSTTEEIPVRLKNSIPFRLQLSAPASVIEIDTGTLIRPPLDEAAIAGVLELEPQNPHVGLIVKWKHPALPGEHRFAKLTLEIPNQPTFVHVFDAAGDIDDFLELPISGSPP